MRAKGLDQLHMLREQLRRSEAEAAQRQAEVGRQTEREAAERELFARSVGPVRAMPPAAKAHVERARPTAHPRQRELDEQRAMQEALSDEVDVESLLLTDDGLSFRRPGIGADVLIRLRRGTWALQAELDEAKQQVL